MAEDDHHQRGRLFRILCYSATVLLGACSMWLAYHLITRDSVVVSGSGILQNLTIEDGHVAYRTTNPWMAGLFLRAYPRSARPYCGGSLIHAEYVITAVQCVKLWNESDILVSLGDFDYTQKSPKTVMQPQIYSVRKISMHKCYYNNETHWLGGWNNLAILQLERPAEISERIQVIRLAEEGETFEGGMANLTGWRWRKDGLRPAFPERLEVEVKEDPFPRKSPSDLGALRTGNGAGLHDYIGGSGGPLSVERDGEVRLIGVLSGLDIDNLSYAIYMRISHYLPWIHSEIKDRVHQQKADEALEDSQCA